jgi:hypothetical protein
MKTRTKVILATLAVMVMALMTPTHENNVDLYVPDHGCVSYPLDTDVFGLALTHSTMCSTWGP